MTTTVVPPAAEPQDPITDAGPLIDVFANLLPDEIVAGRRLAELKRRLLLGVAALLAVLILVYGFSWLQTHQARSTLSSANRHAASMQRQLLTFDPLITAQSASAGIQQTLRTLMTEDLQWKDMLAKVRGAAAGSVAVQTVAATLTGVGVQGVAPAPIAGGLPVLNTTSALPVGTLTITGTAADKNSIAAFVDKLGKVSGLAAALPANVTGTAGKLTYSVDVLITTEALGGRFTTPAVGKGH